MANANTARFKSVKTRNGLYRRCEHESVVENSNRAQLCFQFADLALQGVDLFDAINSLDEDWRMLVADPANQIQHDEAFDQKVTELYRSWLETSQKVLHTYTRLRNDYVERGFDQDRIRALESAVREVEGLLSSDSVFFTDLWTLRDEAIDQHHNGSAEVVG